MYICLYTYANPNQIINIIFHSFHNRIYIYKVKLLTTMEQWNKFPRIDIIKLYALDECNSTKFIQYYNTFYMYNKNCVIKAYDKNMLFIIYS